MTKISAESSDISRERVDVSSNRKTLRTREGFRRDLGLREKVLDPGGEIPQGLRSRLKVHVDRKHGVSPCLGPPESIDLSLIQHLDLLRVDDIEATPATAGRIGPKKVFSVDEAGTAHVSRVSIRVEVSTR
jgi:hypothetical protein